MAKAKDTKSNEGGGEMLVGARYEYRVWGENRKACRKLEKLATESSVEKIEDWYFLVDDPSWNAKVRDGSLKVKELVGSTKGFEQWATSWHDEAESAPAPFDELFEDLRLDRPASGKRCDLPKRVAKLDEDGPRPVFVTKRRRRYRVGDIRAERTEIKIDGARERLHTIAIEGEDLDSLIALRKELGLKKDQNLPMHVAIEAGA